MGGEEYCFFLSKNACNFDVSKSDAILVSLNIDAAVPVRSFPMFTRQLSVAC